MSKLTYLAITSLDGYVADENGSFDWSEPNEEVHAFINELARRIGTYLFGRRMYQAMLAWEDLRLEGQPSYIRDFAELWREADKIVYSRTLDSASSTRTRIERELDPDAVRRLKSAAVRDLGVGGPGIASQAFEAGLVDECHLFVAPVIVGGGTRALPDGVRLPLELLDEHRFGNGTVYLQHRVVT